MAAILVRGGAVGHNFENFQQDLIKFDLTVSKEKIYKLYFLSKPA
jgi:hypothetical protein